jgi:hypothetical protein
MKMVNMGAGRPRNKIMNMVISRPLHKIVGLKTRSRSVSNVAVLSSCPLWGIR